MIIEISGLPGAGKTALAKALKGQGAVLVPLPARRFLLEDASLFWLAHPVLALRLLFYIWTRVPRGARYELFVNGYLGYAARYRRALVLSRQGQTVVLDQGFFQTLISVGGLPMSLLESLPRPDVLVAVLTDISVREQRMLERGWAPRRNFGEEHRLAWQQEAERVFVGVLPTIESMTRVYLYDGTQSPSEGARALMTFVSSPSERLTQVSLIRRGAKKVLAIFSFVLARILSRSPEVVVLMYHAVDRSGWKLAVSPEAFEQQMRFLSERKLSVPLVDIVSYVKGERALQRHAVAVTFDDGYRDVLTTILPILERYRIPATVFVPSDLSVRTDPNGRKRLTQEEVGMIAKSPLITIGSHAKSHTKFTTLSSEEMQRESEVSANELEHMTGQRPRFFAYPFGARSQEAEQVVERAGYEAAFSISEGTIHPGDAPFRLKRVQIDSTMSLSLFRLRLTGAVDWNRNIVDLFRLTNRHA